MTRDSIAETQTGKLQGEQVGQVVRWLGVPYARAQRFEAPQPLTPWSDVRAATKMGAQCPQGMMNKIMADGPDYGEGCLILNVWTPAHEPERKRPVLFWIHGGAFMGGSVNPYDGAELAQRGDMVVVAINYRVGVLGFVNFGEVLGLPSIPSNLGLRDQIAALKWVHENIAAFGGDNARVTICGQSAGSISVSLLMLAKESWPYFQQAIMQSGAVSLIHDREMSRKTARLYAEILDLNQGDLEKLRALPLKTLLETQSKVQDRLEAPTIPAAPWYDDDVLPASLSAAHNAPTPPVPLMAGSTRDEIRLFELMPGPDILPMKRPVLEQIVRAQLPSAQAEEVLAAYPNTKQGTSALATDLSFGMPTRNFAERHARSQPTYFYRFDYPHPIAGATHGLDLLFMWPISGLMGFLLRGGPMSGKRRDLANRIKSHIISFVHFGRPGSDWPRYDEAKRSTLLLNLRDRVEHDPESARRAAWQGKDAGPGITEAFG